ncbi:MAG TPA: hypothetical protein VGN20_10525 [Mucilaginibacter sp.]|jgi:hypothetical protein
MFKFLPVFIFLVALLNFNNNLFAQNTQIKGFIDGITTYQNGQVSFGFEEQDLFITSQITDRISFLGETVFKFSPTSPTDFDVSVERVVFKYNYAGNNSLLFGKQHTPIDYWNDSYHHGRVFYPTIFRPLLFDANIIPLHTTGIRLQGDNLGDIKFGYDFMVGNGLGSTDVQDNDKNKSVTAALHIKPADGLQIGGSFYSDVISKGATPHDFTMPVKYQVNQNLITGSVAYFGKKFEVLAESTFAYNHADSIGTKRTIASYIYGGIRVTDKLVPYAKVEQINYQQGEIYYMKDNVTSFIGGIRYEISYLAVIKLEYEYDKKEIEGRINKITAQFAIGF